MLNFVPGIRLSGLFYDEVVKSILEADFPSLRYSAALIGAGSEVLGFDTEMSTDHDWGPRLQLFLQEEDYQRVRESLRETFSHKLPQQFRNYPTRWLHDSEQGSAHHWIRPLTVSDFFQEYLNFDIRRNVEPADWLTFTGQKLRTLAAGAVYQDEIGLRTVLDRFHYYPPDVWLYLLAAGWNRIAQEEHLMGRAGYVGDELGSALIASRLVRDLIWLCFLMEKQYAPYPKWFGTAFNKLSCAAELGPILRRVQLAETWQEREQHLVSAYEYVAAMHNVLGITEPLPAKAGSFFNRPFQVIHLGGGFAGAIRDKISDPAVRQIASRHLIGSIDQFSDSTDVLSDACWRMALRRLYE